MLIFKVFFGYIHKKNPHQIPYPRLTNPARLSCVGTPKIAIFQRYTEVDTP